MEVFRLPDLGEGLPDAEIVEWHVKEGEVVSTDQALVSMETAKAVVDVPSPVTGTVVKLHGQPGDVIDTGSPLVSFDTGEGSNAADAEVTEAPAAAGQAREDSGTVVGQMESSGQVLQEQAVQVGQFKATPAVRATARKLKVDLGTIQGSGRGGVITMADVKAAASGTAPAAPAPCPPSSTTTTSPAAASSKPPVAAPPVAAPAAAPVIASGEWRDVRGTRRTMARAMSQAHAAVVPTTITEQADLALWQGKQDMTVRMIRALCAAVRREPVLNSWFDADGPKIQTHTDVNVGIAVDTADGLFVSNLRAANQKTPAELRSDLNQLRDNVQNRSIPPADLTGYSIMLSNVGVYAGRYTTPVVTPPCVAILAIGKLRDEVVSAYGGIAVHPVLPLSLTFDHRAVTGGEAARFLAAFMEDVSAAE